MKLTAYVVSEIPNLVSCQVYIKGPNNPNPKLIQAEVVDVDGPAIIGNMSAQSLNLLKLNWAVTVESNSKPTAQPSKLLDVRGKPHPLLLTKEYLLKEYEDVFTGIGCFPGPPYHTETNQAIPPVQHLPRQVPIQLQGAYQEELERLIRAGILLPIPMSKRHGSTLLLSQESLMAPFAYAWTPVISIKPSSAPRTM